MNINKKIIFVKKPEPTFPETCECVKLVTETINLDTQLKDGQFVVKNLYISIDPVQRVFLSQAKTYFPALKVNDTMHAAAISQVIRSQNPNFNVDDFCIGNSGVQEYAILSEKNLDVKRIKIPPSMELSSYMNLINNGVTAYYGLDILKLQDNQTLVVSTAAGATGIYACQIAKLQKNCRVVGLTGSEEKCQFLRSKLDIDCVLNYKDKDFFLKLKQACPNGIDAYFDNIGEEMLSIVLRLMNNFGRVALCGAMSSYGDFKSRKGVIGYSNIISKRIYMQGFMLADFNPRSDEAMEFFERALIDNKLLVQQKVFSGIENYPAAIQHMFQSKNIGKVLVKVEGDRTPQPHL